MDIGLQQKELADILGVSPWTLRLWEAGRTKPEVRYWPAIIEFLGYDPVEEPETFAELLLAARRRLGYSHRKLAAVLGLDPGTVSKWERGEIPRNVRSWQRLEPMFVALGIGFQIRQKHWPKAYRNRECADS